MTATAISDTASNARCNKFRYSGRFAYMSRKALSDMVSANHSLKSSPSRTPDPYR